MRRKMRGIRERERELRVLQSSKVQVKKNLPPTRGAKQSTNKRTFWRWRGLIPVKLSGSLGCGCVCARSGEKKGGRRFENNTKRRTRNNIILILSDGYGAYSGEVRRDGERESSPRRRWRYFISYPHCGPADGEGRRPEASMLMSTIHVFSP